MGKNTLRVAILNAILLMGGTMAYAEAAYAQGQAQTYSIGAGDLESVLSRFGTQSRIQLIYPPELLKGKRSTGLTGNHAPMEALRILLEGSGLVAERVNDKTVVIKKAVAAPAAKPQVKSNDASKAAQVAEPEVKELSAMTVTGTRIRGGTTPSPVITIGAEQIAEEGFSDLGEVIRSIPQNFGGGQNPGVTFEAGLGAGGYANNNITGGSGLNLRGLGPDATLTLLNGRRLAYGGFVQSVDISAIPVEALERIEIVADGASAIYGSDAVGGVGNVILKRDYEGASVGARYGVATDGGLTTREYSVIGGTTWSTGGLIATYKDVSVDPIYAEDRDYTDYLTEPTTIYPGSDLRSGLVSAYQSFGDSVELCLDALRTEREQLSYRAYSANYDYNMPETTTSLVAPSAEFTLPNDWTLSIGGSWGKDEREQYQLRRYFDGRASALWTNNCYCNKSRMYEVGAEGPLFALSGGDARLAVGAGYRKNEFLQYNYLTDTATTHGEESSRFAYAELNLPLIGPDSNIPGVQRLALTGAIRGEDYDSIGGVTTPKLGVIYGPSADFTLKVSWGRSFKTPTLYQRYYASPIWLLFPSDYGGTGYASDATLLIVDGGNAHLDPERAKTWSASVALHPEALPGFEAELTWFDINYTDRVVQPITSWTEALSNPNYAEFVDYSPTAEEQAEAIASAAGFYNYVGADYDPSKVVAIVYAQYINATRQRVKGIDLSGSYRLDLGAGRLTIRGSASWLDSTQQTAGTPSTYDLAGVLYNPAKLKGRIGSVWNQGGFSASVFANYTSGVTNTADGKKTASFTTFDTTLRYAIGELGNAWSGLEFELSAQNLLNRAPPLHTPIVSTYVPYDSTNYSAIGRFLSISVSKHF